MTANLYKMMSFLLCYSSFIPSYKFQNLKHCVSGGEPINPEVMDQWKTKTSLDIYEGYGQTETVSSALLPMEDSLLIKV